MEVEEEKVDLKKEAVKEAEAKSPQKGNSGKGEK